MVERDAVDHRCPGRWGFGMDLDHLTSAADVHPLARPNCAKLARLH